MISASEIHELRFEKAAFGYKQEDIAAVQHWAVRYPAGNR